MIISHVEDIVLSTGSTSIVIDATAVVYTNSFNLAGAMVNASVELTWGGTTPVNVKVELEVGTSRPTTEGAADSTWTEPEGLSDIGTFIVAETNNKALGAISHPFGRLKLTGLDNGDGTNAADTSLRAKLSMQEER